MTKNGSGFCLHIMRGKFTLSSLWFSTDLTFHHWILMNQYWNALTRGSGPVLDHCFSATYTALPNCLSLCQCVPVLYSNTPPDMCSRQIVTADYFVVKLRSSTGTPSRGSSAIFQVKTADGAHFYPVTIGRERVLVDLLVISVIFFFFCRKRRSRQPELSSGLELYPVPVGENHQKVWSSRTFF